MGVIGSLRKSVKLRRISKTLGRPADPSRFLENLQSGGESRFEHAVHDLLILCESDPVLRRVLDIHRAGPDRLQEIFELLLNAGAGQWVGGHYVPVSTLAFAPTLDFVLTNAGRLSPQNIGVLLLEYFERGDVGPVPLDVRGPADPNDPLRRIWELEQSTKGKMFAGSRATPSDTTAKDAKRASPKPSPKTIDTDGTSRIEEYATDAHAHLTRFVAIHNDIFAPPFSRSVRRLIPIPGILKPVPYTEYASTLRMSKDGMARLAAACTEDLSHPGTSALERDTLDAIATFCGRFATTIDALAGICAGLARELEERAGPSFRDYKASVAQYEDRRRQSTIAGSELNVALANFRQNRLV